MGNLCLFLKSFNNRRDATFSNRPLILNLNKLDEIQFINLELSKPYISEYKRREYQFLLSLFENDNFMKDNSGRYILMKDGKVLNQTFLTVEDSFVINEIECTIYKIPEN